MNKKTFYIIAAALTFIIVLKLIYEYSRNRAFAAAEAKAKAPVGDGSAGDSGTKPIINYGGDNGYVWNTLFDGSANAFNNFEKNFKFKY